MWFRGDKLWMKDEISGDSYDYEPTLECHGSKEARAIMGITFGLGIIGLVLNIVSCMVWSNYEKNKIIAPHIYLTALAITDSIAIVFDAFIDGLECLTGSKFFEFSTFACLIDTLLDFLTTFSTYWVIAIIVLDRCASLLYPVSYKNRFCKPKTAYISLTSVLGFLTLLGLASLVGQLILNSQNPGADMKQNCGLSGGLYYNIMLYGSLFFGVILPFAIVILCTLIIVREISKQEKQHQKRESATRGGRNSDGGTHRRTTSVLYQEQLVEFRNIAAVLAVIFVLLCGSAQGFSLYSHGFWKSSEPNNSHAIADSLDELLNVINSSVNFFLYCFSSGQFRTQLKSMVSRSKPKLKSTDNQQTIRNEPEQNMQLDQITKPQQHSVQWSTEL